MKTSGFNISDLKLHNSKKEIFIEEQKHIRKNKIKFNFDNVMPKVDFKDSVMNTTYKGKPFEGLF